MTSPRTAVSLVLFLAALAIAACLRAAEPGEEAGKEPAKEPAKGEPKKPGKEALKIEVQKGAPFVWLRMKGEIRAGEVFEVRRGETGLLGYAQATEVDEGQAKLQVLLGVGRAGDELAAVALPMPMVQLLTDEPDGAEAKELKALCGSRLVVVPIDEKMRRPLPDEVLVAIAHNRGHFMMGDPLIERHAREGGTVVCDTLLYGEIKGVEAVEPKLKKAPALRIISVGPLTAGFASEDRIPWFGTERKKFLARYWNGQPKSEDALKALATDETTRNAALLEEAQLGGGRMVVLDLASPNGRAGRDPGSKNKWLFVARALGTGPRYGRFRASKPELDDLLGWFDGLAKENSDRISKAFEGGGATKEEFIHSYTLGPRDKPAVILVAGLEGNEWLGPCALLGLADALLGNPERDPKIDWLLQRLRIKIIPVLNLYGYRKDTPVNPRKVELNRNFAYRWEEYADKKGRGQEPFSEPESRLLKTLVENEKAIALLEIDVDAYDSGYRIVRARDLREAQQNIVRTVRAVLNARLTGRAIVNGDQPLQLKLLRDADRPSAINWAGAKGVLAASLKICGDGEDSLISTDVAIEGALAFLTATALSIEKPPPPEPPAERPPRRPTKAPTKKAAE